MTKKIKRPVRAIDPNQQLSMFGDQALVLKEAIEKKTEKRRLAGFIDPDPEELRINLIPLREFLQSMEMQWVIELRDFIRSLDFTAFHAAYNLNGRPPYAPQAMLGLVLYGILRGHSSLREIELLARSDLGAMWISGGICPDHSIIGRFLTRHQELIGQDFFLQLTTQIVAACRINPQFFAGDGTTIQAAASRFHTITLEAAQLAQAQLREQIEALEQQVQQACDEEVSKKKSTRLARKLKQQHAMDAAVQVGESRVNPIRHNVEKRATTLRLAKSEPESCVLKMKEGNYCPAYVASALTCDQRIIHGLHVDPSNELNAMKPMLEQAEVINQAPATTLLLDSNYHRHEIARLAAEKDINLLSPSNFQVRQARENTWQEKFNKSKKQSKYDKSEFQYDRAGDVYICPNHQLLHPGGVQNRANERPHTAYRAGKQACESCPVRIHCTSAKNGRVIKRYQDDEHLENISQAMQQPEAQALYNRRQGSVEPVFSSLKNTLKLRRFRRRGIASVTLEFSLYAMAHNLRRRAVLQG